MNKYDVLHKEYRLIKDENARSLFMKDFMLSLPTDELIDWLSRLNERKIN